MSILFYFSTFRFSNRVFSYFSEDSLKIWYAVHVVGNIEQNQNLSLCFAAPRRRNSHSLIKRFELQKIRSKTKRNV